jgi:diguanylate cyclase (GGDEF)-like protein
MIARGVCRYCSAALLLCVWLLATPLLRSQNAPSSLPQSRTAPNSPVHQGGATFTAARRQAPPLTRVDQVRKLNQQQAASLVPVQLHGVVTAFSGYRNSFFFADEKTGISVDRTDHAVVRVGDMAVISGTSGAGLFAPVVNASSVRVVGRSAMPVAGNATYGDLIGGRQDSQWIAVQGIVHSARISPVFGHDALVAVVDLGGGSIQVVLHDFAGIDYARLVDTTVRIRGVCYTTFNEKRQFIGVALAVPDRKYMEVLQPARDDLFLAPVTPVRNALQFGQMAHRIKVSGIVTYQAPGHALYLQDGTDGIEVQTSALEVVKPGTRVEALGFPVMGEYAPLLEDGLLHVTDMAPPVAPRRVEARDVIAHNQGFVYAPYDQQLVQIQATVVENLVQADQRVWILRQQDKIFQAFIPLSAATAEMADLGNGSNLLLTGICTVHTDSSREPVSFSLLVRSASDVVILKRTPWWTAGHTLLLLAALAAITLAVVLWIVVLRNRVQQQTSMLRESEERFRSLAQHDVLTGLPNRLMLEERILKCLTRCKAEGAKAAFFTIDLDRFKHINDTYGHQIADECLKTVGERLRSCVRKEDTIARTGGEEFTLVAAGLADGEAARRVASDLLELFHDPIIVPGHEIDITISVGAALYPDDGTDSNTLQRRSDQALYAAKRAGRNRVVFATKALAASSELVTAIESSLRETLRSGGFSLHYQALYDGAGAIRRFEALLRTTDERLVEAGLATFIAIAEESGLIIPLGKWVLEEACHQIAEWQSLGIRSCQVAVNVSARQLLHKGFADEVLAILARLHVDPALVQLELTETAVMTELAPAAEAVSRLAKAGLTFAIDDFGTGYSSLSRLRELPIKTLKIDRSFVQGLVHDEGSYSIILAIIQMAKSLKVHVVAEGVETLDQFSILKEMGCDLFQGYLFARPAPAAAAIQALVENRAKTKSFVGAPAAPRSFGVSPAAR